MDFKTRAFFIAAVAVCFFLITSTDPSVTVTEARSNAASAAVIPLLTPAHSPQSAPAETPSVSALTPPPQPALTTASEPLPVSKPTPSDNTLPSTAQNIFRVTAWLQANDWSAGVESVREHASLLRETSPAWFAANGDGSVSEREASHVDDGALRQVVEKNNIALRPLVMSVPGVGASPQALALLLKNPDLRKKQIDELVSLAASRGYDGFDLDYESIPVANLPDLATYIEELAAALHARGKTLAVSLDTQPSASVLRAWERIGKAADSVRLMAYGIPSKTPAPVVDLAWMQARLAHALKAIPKEKLSLGIPLYCNKWNGSARSSNTWAKMHIEKTLPIACGDASLVKNELEIAQSLGVTSVAFWRLGGEDPAIWQEVSAR